jgi:alginate O-acetyltransferase complex protein AlgI
MLFNSYAFLFAYLPLTLAGFYLFARRSRLLAAGWMALASLAFYGYWNIAFVPLLCGSIVFNFLIGSAITKVLEAGRRRASRWLLVTGIAADLALLAYFKYAGFLVINANAALGAAIPVPEIVLPLGISFFTFTQIAFLVDAARGIAREYSFPHYTLFVAYFPHLIAGPILHHKEMIPQFRAAATYRFNAENFSRGLAFFAVGLFKKVALADGVAHFVAPAFNVAAQGGSLTFLEAWLGALAYTLQLYFDFSGYCDMAVGLSWLFNVRLPFNFDSPYKATSIIDFWRRWHMTLSRFLRDYLYFSLGGNRHGAARRYLNLLVTMLLGGLWHGASWTFVVWGALHGGYLMINHGWQALSNHLGFRITANRRLVQIASQALTLLSVIVAWVFFRANSIDAALGILGSMSGHSGVTLPASLVRYLPATWSPALAHWGVHFGDLGSAYGGVAQVLWIAVLMTVCLYLPNTQQWIDSGRGSLRWTPSTRWAAVLGLATAWCILQLGNLSEFLYFQF